jgi:hypothetical protein
VIAQTTASSGNYNLTIVNADCSVVIFGNAINVGTTSAIGGLAKAKPAAAPAAPRPKPTPKTSKPEASKN